MLSSSGLMPWLRHWPRSKGGSFLLVSRMVRPRCLHHRARPHVDDLAQRAHQMGVLVFQFEHPVAARDQLDFQGHRSRIERAALAADGQGDLAADGHILQRRHAFGIGDGHAGALDVVFQQRPHHIGAVARRAAADIVGRLDQQHRTLAAKRNCFPELAHHLVEVMLLGNAAFAHVPGDLGQFAQAPPAPRSASPSVMMLKATPAWGTSEKA